MNVSVFSWYAFLELRLFSFVPYQSSWQATKLEGTLANQQLSKGPVPSAPGDSSAETEAHRATAVSTVKLKEKCSLDLKPMPSARARD